MDRSTKTLITIEWPLPASVFQSGDIAFFSIAIRAGAALPAYVIARNPLTFL